MSAEDGVSLLLKTALKEIDDEGSRQLGAKVVETLGYLALAIVQAGAVSFSFPILVCYMCTSETRAAKGPRLKPDYTIKPKFHTNMVINYETTK